MKESKLVRKIWDAIPEVVILLLLAAFFVAAVMTTGLSFIYAVICVLVYLTISSVAVAISIKKRNSKSS